MPRQHGGRLRSKTVTTGPTPELQLHPDHLAQLIERHEVSLPVLPGISTDERDLLWHRCAMRAERWLTDEGLQAVLNYFHQSTDPAVDGEEMCVGVWWDVVVGKATSTTAADTGGMDVVNGLAWTWSARWQHWHGWFKSMALAERAKARVSSPGGEVVPIAAYQDALRRVLDRHREPPVDHGYDAVAELQRVHAYDAEERVVLDRQYTDEEIAASPYHGMFDEVDVARPEE